MELVIGIDVGSVSTKMVALDRESTTKASVYLETQGAPLLAIQKCLRELKEGLDENSFKIIGVGCTGSGRKLASIITGGDLVKNEITSQVIACLSYNPKVSSIIEIGGQDSKTILLEDRVPVWHNLSSICAAGTGSFLTSQAYRLKIPIEEFGSYALRSTVKVSIASKCTVFAESDMIAKAASGYAKEDIINGLCEGLVRNFINNVARNRPLGEPTIFSGGVASNVGVVKAFEKELNHAVIVPKEHKLMGCIGVAQLVWKQVPKKTNFKGFEIADANLRLEPFECETPCPNNCELVAVKKDEKIISILNSRCGRYQ